VIHTQQYKKLRQDQEVFAVLVRWQDGGAAFARVRGKCSFWRTLMLKCLATFTLAALFVCGLASRVHAASLTNGGFETGNFSGWSTAGATAVIGKLIGPTGIAPTQGSKQAGLSTALTNQTDSQLEIFLGLSAGALDGLGNGDAKEGSAIKQTFTANAGEVLSFRWNFLTNEQTPGADARYNDFVFVTLISVNTLANTYSNFINAPFVSGFDEQTGFQTFSQVLPSSGNYTLGIGVIDVTDTLGASGLLIDDVRLSATPEPGTMILLGSSLVGLVFWRHRQTV
jgi:hypothetical protein